MDLLTAHLIREEGLRLHPYKDHKGYWTIGVGHLIDNRKGGSFPTWIGSFPLTRKQAKRLLREDILAVRRGLITPRRSGWFFVLSEVRQTILLSMAFQMGVRGLLGFKNTLRFIRGGEYARASRGMLNSKWARKDTPERAKRMSEAMRTGVLEV